MKDILKKFLLIVFTFIIGFIPSFFTFAMKDVVVLLPDSIWDKDVNIDYPQVESNESTIFWYIQRTNRYLWIAIIVVSMAVLLYAWIQLITAWWDKSKVSKAWKLALSLVIAIFVAMLSYTLVNLVVNLF